MGMSGLNMDWVLSLMVILPYRSPKMRTIHEEFITVLLKLWTDATLQMVSGSICCQTRYIRFLWKISPISQRLRKCITAIHYLNYLIGTLAIVENMRTIRT